jgi:hypothetical protein
MKNVYLIFPNPSDIYSYATITCTKEELGNTLIEAELIEEGENYKDFSWVIFENGKMIQG